MSICEPILGHQWSTDTVNALKELLHSSKEQTHDMH